MGHEEAYGDEYEDEYEEARGLKVWCTKWWLSQCDVQNGDSHSVMHKMVTLTGWCTKWWLSQGDVQNGDPHRVGDMFS